MIYLIGCFIAFIAMINFYRVTPKEELGSYKEIASVVAIGVLSSWVMVFAYCIYLLNKKQ